MHLTYDKGNITNQNEKDALFNKRWKNNQLPIGGKWNWNPYHIVHEKIDTKWVKHINKKAKLQHF